MAAWCALYLHAVFRRKKRYCILEHYGWWSIVLILYTPVVYTSISILNCPYIDTVGKHVSQCMCVVCILPRLVFVLCVWCVHKNWCTILTQCTCKLDTRI